MRRILFAFALFLTALPAIAQDNIRMAANTAPSDPGMFYRFIHGFAPETAVSMWRGSTRPPLTQLLQKRGFEMGAPVYLRLFKYEGVIEVWMKRGEQFDLFEVYPICINSGALGPKLKEGDRQAPEGFYEINAKSLNPNSKYHLAINMGYPNAYDRELGRTGAHLMIHGACASIGCYALTDENIEEVYTLVKAALDNGQDSIPVHAFPFRMTDDAMKKYSASKWYGFWSEELRPATIAFDETRVPPMMMSCDGKYRLLYGLDPDDLGDDCTPITAR